jgi:hypothetical protein
MRALFAPKWQSSAKSSVRFRLDGEMFRISILAPAEDSGHLAQILVGISGPIDLLSDWHIRISGYCRWETFAEQACESTGIVPRQPFHPERSLRAKAKPGFAYCPSISANYRPSLSVQSSGRSKGASAQPLYPPPPRLPPLSGHPRVLARVCHGTFGLTALVFDSRTLAGLDAAFMSEDKLGAAIEEQHVTVSEHETAKLPQDALEQFARQ